MLYWFVFFVLLFFSIKEIKSKRINQSIFNFLWIVLVLMVSLRQGQGTDYYNYLDLYREVKFFSNQSVWLLFTQSDPGFRLLYYIIMKLGISYEVFSCLFSFITMFFIYPFFRTHCNKSIIALFIFYASSFYLIYMFSAIRQGFVIAVFLGKLYPLLYRKQYKKFCFYVVLLSCIHISSLILLFVPYIYNKRIGQNALMMLSILGILFMFINPFEIVLSSLGFYRLDRYIGDETTTTKYFSIILRIIVLLPIFLLPKSIYKKYDNLNVLRNFIFINFIIYSIFSFSELTASRLGIYFKVFEGCFLAFIIHKTNLRIISKQICYGYMLLTFVLFAKDINAFITQGNYKNCTIWTYPYLSVFESKNTIQYYRSNIE